MIPKLSMVALRMVPIRPLRRDAEVNESRIGAER